MKQVGLAVAGTAGAVTLGGLGAGAEAAANGLINPKALVAVAVVGAAGGGVAYWKKRRGSRAESATEVPEK